MESTPSKHPLCARSDGLLAPLREGGAGGEAVGEGVAAEAVEAAPGRAQRRTAEDCGGGGRGGASAGFGETQVGRDEAGHRGCAGRAVRCRAVCTRKRGGPAPGKFH